MLHSLALRLAMTLRFLEVIENNMRVTIPVEKLIDGREIAGTIITALQTQLATTTDKPLLAIVLVGDDPASRAYIFQKRKTATAIGLPIALYHFAPTITTDALKHALTDIQAGNSGTWQSQLLPSSEETMVPKRPAGIIVQRPLPKPIDYQTILAAIDPKLDVDGFLPASPYPPPVGLAVIKILEHIFPGTGTITERVGDKQVVLIGYGETAGKPIAQVFEMYGISYQLIRSKTPAPQKISSMADILVTALGKPGFITPDWVKAGAVVIDVGISRITATAGGAVLSGDCSVEVVDKAGSITPVPGGVGPVNVACLFVNVCAAASQ